MFGPRPRRTILLLLTAAAVAAPIAAQQTTTTSYGAPTPLCDRAGEPLQVPGHAAVRVADWDQDNDLDVLVGGGDGRIWLLENRPAPGDARLALGPPRQVKISSRARWGQRYTGAALADLTDDGLPELLVAHSRNKLSVHVNEGVRGAPRFAAAAADLTLQNGCDGRFDVADCDGDGLPDLVTGAFSGRVAWHRNIGTPRAPRFATDQPLGDVNLAYNAHPRVLDFDGDAHLDLLLGVNWGTFSLYRGSANGFAKPEQLRSATNGEGLNLRGFNGDDTTPELVDVDGDGVLDLISGGKNGKLFTLRGVSRRERVDRLTALLRQAETPSWFEEHEQQRDAAFAALGALQADLAAGLVSGPERESLFKALSALPSRHPELLRRRRHDLEETPHAPMLAAQFWVVLLEAAPATADPRTARREVADALGFEGGYRRLLVDLGVVFYDNGRASARQLERMHTLLTSLPRRVWDVELISVAGWLGPGAKRHRVQARTGVNIFAMKLGVPENSFPKDAPRPGITDVYLICLAHEVAHNMLDTVGRSRRPALFARKFDGLQNAAGDAVVYRQPRARGIDMDATKERFERLGRWDGVADTWPQAWRAYFDDVERFDKSYARGNCRFFLEAPQEAFSTLANQYVADSQLMLEFSKARWDQGHRNVVNQFLLIADYLSDGNDTAPTYVLKRGGQLTVGTARLTRDKQQRITSFKTEAWAATFSYSSADDDMASEFTATPRDGR